MATLEICAVHDRQIDAFMRPFVVQSTGQAIRMFRDLTNEDKSDINKHPEDYALFRIGTFDETTGTLYGLKEGPEQLALASNLIERAAKRD